MNRFLFLVYFSNLTIRLCTRRMKTLKDRILTYFGWKRGMSVDPSTGMYTRLFYYRNSQSLFKKFNKERFWAEGRGLEFHGFALRGSYYVAKYRGQDGSHLERTLAFLESESNFIETDLPQAQSESEWTDEDAYILGDDPYSKRFH